MPGSQSFDDDEFPVLTDITKPGDAGLIEAARATHEEIQRSVAPDVHPPPLTPAELSRSITAPAPATHATQPFATRSGTRLPLSESQLEQLIDEIVERHAEQMRNELHTILKHRE